METDKHTARGRIYAQIPILDSSISPIQTIQDWLSHCDNNHAETCSLLVSASDPQHNTSWLIDAVNRCIVPGTTSNDYLALSYTWEHETKPSNEESELQLLNANTPMLTKVNGLDQYFSRIPKVIKDAMGLTIALGKQYLWVDRLCIVQDDPGKESEFHSMDRVYSGAYMTIVAAAKYGIFNSPEETIDGMGKHNPWYMCCKWENGPPPRSEKQAAGDIERHYDSLSNTRWAQRGWTYQEYILSRRVVFFTGWTLFWQCECSIWDLRNLQPTENNEVPYKHPSGLGEIRHLSAPSWPDTSLYTDLVCVYNGRDLTQQSDGLFAFLGILNRLAPAFPQGFLFGLPRYCFDHALLWQPLKNYRKDRWVSKREAPPKVTPPVRRPTLPSWAWCGWQCFIDPTSFNTAIGLSNNDRDKENSWRLRNPVTWQYSNSVEHLRSQHISAYVSRATFSPAATLAIQEYHAPSRYRFAQNSYASMAPQPYVNLILNQKPLDCLAKVVVLQDAGGSLAGMVRITGDSTCEPEQKMELIAISEGSADGRDLKSCFEDKVLRRSIYADPKPFRPKYDSQQRWHDIEEERSKETRYQVITEGEFVPRLNLPEYEDDIIYNFYNVLWVERGSDDVAYRVGCGRVFKAAWEAIATEIVRITLG
ncbi:heterokaryon incompatibility [Fusarium longipes]|uniref:Heterokaryon incompatibility n=1 Tax=Fusarium longipes TaxID=694270 RepID=A0A395T666_9HYPO|nr:heterokaryon incompatibility [Fusarium longipes]